MAVNVWCCGLLECTNYGPAPPTSALRVSVRVTSPIASGIRPFLEAQVGLYRSQTGFILWVFSRMDMPQGSGGLIMEFPSPSTKQWNYLTHSWELGLQTQGHIHTPVGHACHASRGLVSSKTLWFCLESRIIQLPSTIYHL
jgi:hypothetical protein